MKQKAEIVDYINAEGNDGYEYLDTFLVQLNDGDIVEVKAQPFLPEEYLEREELIVWAGQQIGNFVLFDDIVPVVYVAKGKTYIVG